MEKFEAAVDDFDASTYLDIQYFRGYYWKAYALCKLVESGRTEFTSRAQAAFAMLHFKFKHSKLNDIEKLQSQFAELLLAIEYKFVSRVSELKELERRFGVQNDFSNVSFTIILAEGCYDLKKMTILGGRFYFVCPPGNTATLNCIKGLYLSQGSFLFENITFLNPYPLIPAVVSCTVLGAMAHTMMMLNNGREEMDVNNFDTLTFGGTRHQTETEMTNPCALVEANDVHSLSMDHCLITDAKSSGIVVKFTESSLEERSVSVRLSRISCCRGTGLHLQENAPLCHISIRDNEFEHNLYGIFIDSPSPFHLENNYIFSNTLSGVVAVRSSEGRLVRNTLAHNGKHGILFAKTNAVMKGNEISNNHGWGVVCSCESDLHCADETLFERNLCGGLRVVFNGKGNVSVQRCEFRENYGPVVFPVDQLSRMEVKCNQLLTASQKSPVPFSVFFFLEGVGLTSPCISELKSPVLLDNRVSDDSEVLSDTEPKFCSTCLKDQETESEQIECPSCHVARYCSQECCDAAEPVHCPVCKSILEANKECHVYDVWPLSDAPPVEDHDAIRAGISMCIIATVTLTRLTSVDKALDIPYHFCLLTCPERELCSLINSAIIHHFVAIHGSHLPDLMLDTKAACILANFDSESSRITVYKHRIFPLEKVSDASKWLNKTLDVFGARFYGWVYSTPEPWD
ncbi:hypothetical protein OS493_004553 [Desmophyllum pertusum]|uniref:MYND-type domain-containing protein n=1 Tax=Desmophyllum pertusum TaxID=174260 RepID=A0A9W9ZG93_9CNID|nr:hypothetical protein OS493_004553 [Desmophyllum pertusum]